MRLLASIIFSSVLISCVNRDLPTSSNGIVGEWQVTEYLADPGDGSGTWQTANGPSFLTFRRDNTLQSRVDVLGFFNDYNRYKIVNDSALYFFKSTAPKDSLPMGFRQTGRQLTLYPPCIEGCGLRLSKSKDL